MSTSSWPKQAYTVGNAGVMLVGRSAEHGNIPCVILGGRFYTRKRVYAYTDFGGGVDRQSGETPQEGAFREFAEEFFSHNEDEAKSTARKMCAMNSSALVGGRPFIHKNSYAIFIVLAEAIAEAMEGPFATSTTSVIDEMFALAKQNSELTSVALVSVEELLRGAFADGMVRPISVRQLDNEERSSHDHGISLRHVMVGPHGSILTIKDALENFTCQPSQLDGFMCHPSRLSNSSESGVPEFLGAYSDQDRVIANSSEGKKRRWGAQNQCGRRENALLAGPNPTANSRESRRNGCGPKPFVFDMETGDPDDVLTLLFLGSHPDVLLRAVTITPGSEEQVALVRWLLREIGLENVRLGAQQWPENAKKCVNLNTRFYKSFGRLHEGEPDCEPADKVILECCDENVTLVTGAPLHNLGDALKLDGFKLGLLVAQGGFAGEGVVPQEKQMDKFRGKITCPTWNFGGNINAAQAALACAAISRKICVSKNVCHSAIYNEDWHRALRAAAETQTRNEPKSRRALAFGMMYKTMDEYLQHKPGGKALHDPLALAVALNESVCEMVEVELFCQKGQWGSRLSPESNIWISIDYDVERFRDTLLG